MEKHAFFIRDLNSVNGTSICYGPSRIRVVLRPDAIYHFTDQDSLRFANINAKLDWVEPKETSEDNESMFHIETVVHV